MTDMRRVVVTTLANGTEIALYLHELVGGAGDGPTVGLCAAIHGNEPTGSEIVLELARRFACRKFRGRLLLLPVANPPAFEANRRNTPVDDMNLNRLFPGNEGGWFSDQLASTITSEFLTQVDVLIDIHAGGDRPTVDYIYIRNAEELSRAFGSKVLYRADPSKAGTMFEGTSISVTEAKDVPSVTVELGGGQIDQSPYVERGVRGVTNILSTLEMLDEPPAPRPDQIVVNSIQTIRPRVGGFLESECPPLGETIEKDAVLGRVVSPYTFEELEVIQNPVPKGIMILSHLTRNVVQPGDYGYMVGVRL
jgi:predicted deacylase